MEISDVHVKIIRNTTDRLKAVCTITFENEFVVRDVKVVEGTNGMFVAMPSRKLSVHCKTCSYKNHLRAKYCNECGTNLDHKPMPSDTDGRTRLHRDIAHPITPAFRELVQERVINAYEEEYEKSRDSVTESNHAEVEPDTKEDTSEPMDEYDEIIANLKGSRRSRSEKDDKSSQSVSSGDEKTSDHIDDDEQPQPDIDTPSAIVSTTDESGDDEAMTSEEEASTTVIQSEQESESVRQSPSSERDNGSSFGEGIL